MKIQLLTQEKKVLYELEQSDLFPDYRSVLQEVITLKIDLTYLSAEPSSRGPEASGCKPCPAPQGQQIFA